MYLKIYSNMKCRTNPSYVYSLSVASGFWQDAVTGIWDDVMKITNIKTVFTSVLFLFKYTFPNIKYIIYVSI